MEKSTLKMAFFILILNAINLLSTQSLYWQEQTEKAHPEHGQWFRIDEKGHVWHSGDFRSWTNITQLFAGKTIGSSYTGNSQRKRPQTHHDQAFTTPSGYFYTDKGDLLWIED